MIRRLLVNNFKSIRVCDLSLGQITVLTGPNGAGKSTLLDALRFLQDAVTLSLEQAFSNRHGVEAVARVTPTESTPIVIAAELEGSDIQAFYRLTIVGEHHGFFRVAQEVCRSSTYEGSDQYVVEQGLWKQKPTALLNQSRGSSKLTSLTASSLAIGLTDSIPMLRLQRYLSDISVYSIVPSMMRSEVEPWFGLSRLQSQGMNLPVAIDAMEQYQSPWLVDLKASLRKAIPDILDFRVMRRAGRLTVKFRHRDLVGKELWLDPWQESDGTLRIMGLLTALYQDPPPSLLALEEPETFIHPGALIVLADIIREAAKRTQVIITTHSPELLSRFRAEEIKVVELVEGETLVGNITEYQRGVINDKLFSVGELMLAQGLEREMQSS